MPRVLTIVGARPQFIKAAPVSRALRQAGLEEILVHTGQHFDPMMSDVFFEELEIPKPARNLDVHGLSHGAMTARMLEGLEAAMVADKPNLVLVYGDTNSTLAGGLAAAKLRIPLAHVEAGLRSFNRAMPEEVNRVLVDHVSDLLFCPTQAAVDHLAAEGITRGVSVTGDVMYDTTLAAIDKARSRSEVLARLGVARGQYMVATIHRAENTDDPARFEQICRYLEDMARDIQIILPAHPRTAALMRRTGRTPKGVRVVEPLGYLDMALLVNASVGVLTDSGGLQKEAYFHRVPCVTLRDETEWVETLAAGWNRLWTDSEPQPQRTDIPDYGDGRAAETIASTVARFLA
ncbi:MAG: UDP-N-acetylglucosamine 2-epimerase (non-hydrolyzing) [Bosea sp.]|uniref:non-hydrolyzing UDP-N-acetylglucosamine 2-epimerase n=1 Tax=Bosea sp. (in: a-proteobacteria) TaxID=1871050 RepID=UPI001AD04393|nr:UDP-N-acetylglucosamine 2-epimerase (non-hydrolyzing) [Bosea sp. (in: a-proteobacteria)]MBN9471554.1 UDP-N-acetylglucosamine 2-epimerase (non-hydrolyzing) [Bosea sp. (in: a-proteobacteria)]